MRIVDNQNLNPAGGGAHGDNQDRWPFMGQRKARIKGQVRRMLSENCHSQHKINIRSWVGFREWIRNKEQTNIFACHRRAQSRKGNRQPLLRGISTPGPRVFENTSYAGRLTSKLRPGTGV